MALRVLACATVLACAVWVAGRVGPVWPTREQDLMGGAAPPIPAVSLQLATRAAPAAPPAARGLGAEVSKEQAVKMVQAKFRARVVRTVTRQEGGHTWYVMRLLSDSGHVWTVRVDAATGSIR